MVETINKLELDYVRKTYGRDAIIEHIVDYGVGGEKSAQRRCAVDQLCERQLLVDYYGTKVLYVSKAAG